MKKNYSKPVAEELSINVLRMFASSNTLMGFGGTGSGGEDEAAKKGGTIDMGW